MRREYVTPELELFRFPVTDIISTSDEDEGPILPPDDDDPDITTDPTGPTETTTEEDEGPIL